MIVLLPIVGEEYSRQYIPPPWKAVLPLIVLPLIVGEECQTQYMAPPYEALPLVSVKPESSPPAAPLNITHESAWLPSIVVTFVFQSRSVKATFHPPWMARDLLVMDTFSTYVPAATLMVSPLAAASMAG